jgi:hypothetical protein
MSARCRLPNRRFSETFSFDCGPHRYTATISYFPGTDQLAEIFLGNGRAESDVDAAWRAHPGGLVGVRTGAVSDLSALDVDRDHREAAQWWEENRDRLPATRMHATRRFGGIHVLFRHHPGIACTASRLCRGVDTRGEGGYVVWWPAYGCAVLNDAPIAAAPAWLIETLRPPPPSPRPVSHVPDDRALYGLIRTVAGAAEGERNAITFWAACRCAEMVAAGFLDADTAIALIVEAASRAGLPQAEALRTARSGLRTVWR